MKMQNRVLGLGEVLARFTSERGVRIQESDNFRCNYGGAELNVLVSLCHLGHEGRILTRLGNDSLSCAAFDHIIKNRVDTSFIKRDGNPLGLYFLEEGEGSRPSMVVYNRSHSSATMMTPSDFDFAKALEGVSILHISGITLAISDSSMKTALALMEEAKKRGVKVSFDFNYRAKLMSVEKAKEVYPIVAKHADIVSASPWDIKTLLGFHPDESDNDRLFMDACKEFGFDYLFTKKRVILSQREQRLQAFGYTAEKKVTGVERQFEIFDRIGAGDAFAAGYLHGLLLDYSDPLSAIEYGIANSILEQTIFGDSSLFTHENLLEFLATSGLGEVKR